MLINAQQMSIIILLVLGFLYFILAWIPGFANPIYGIFAFICFVCACIVSAFKKED